MKVPTLHLALLIAASPVVMAAAAKPDSPASTESASCPFSEQKPCVIELHGPKAPSVSPNCTVEPWSRFVSFTLPNRIADSNRDGWWETVMKVALDVSKDCAGATFRVFYDKPEGYFSVNIGDSPTNNGFGGDAGTTFKAAETLISGGRLFVYTSPLDEGVGIVETIYEMALPTLPRRSLELAVRDESLAFSVDGVSGGTSPWLWKLQTPFSGLLYDLSPSVSYDGLESAKKRADGIYAAFNRVIHDKNGAPTPPQRVGTGVRRVEVRLAP